MKKSFFLSILAVGALVACSKSEVVETSFDNAIKFDNYVGRDAQTKAAVVTGEAISEVMVNAYLYKKDATEKTWTANFMENQAVKKSGSDWTYEPYKYWPAKDQVIDFVGWVDTNLDGETANLTVEDATLTFNVPTDVTKQTDLLVANPVIAKNGATEATPSPVALNFKHLLSRIGFTIKATGVPNTAVTVSTLDYIKLNGSFAPMGTVDMTASTPVVTPDADATATEVYELKGANFGWTDSKIQNSEDGVSNSDNSYIMLIPTDAEPSSITVKYTITTYKVDADGNVVTGEDGKPVVDGEPIVNESEFSLADVEYVAGTAYKYVFNITMSGISFTVVETPWSTPETEVDITPKDNTENA